MTRLEKLRKRLGQCDEILLDAILMRHHIIKDIMAYKEENGLNILDPDRFIETYLAGDTFNEAQKEFLIKCLEEGDTVEEMKTYASASLTPAMMQRLRQVRKKRRGQ